MKKPFFHGKIKHEFTGRPTSSCFSIHALQTYPSESGQNLIEKKKKLLCIEKYHLVIKPHLLYLQHSNIAMPHSIQTIQLRRQNPPSDTEEQDN